MFADSEMIAIELSRIAREALQRAHARITGASAPAADRQHTEREAAWESDCKPRVVTDDLGVSRYVYAHAGCEEGAR